MSASGICPRCGHVVGTIHSRPECDANYDYAYKRRMTELEAKSKGTVQARLDAGGSYFAVSNGSVGTGTFREAMR